MPKAKDSFRIDVTETTNAETRVITMTISAPVQEFMLADLLRKRGVLSNLDASLKQAVREAMQKHLDGAEELIASLVAGQQKGNGAGKGKVQMETGEAGNRWEKEPEAELKNEPGKGVIEEPEIMAQGREARAYGDGE